MKAVPLPMVRYRLGAEELIELGRPARGPAFPGGPFLAGRAAAPAAPYAPHPGDADRDVRAFVAGRLGRGLGLLDGMVKTPAGLLSSGADAVSAGAADLLGHVPAAGCVMAQVLLLGSAAVKSGIAVPDGRRGLDGALAGLSRALGSAFGEDGKRERVEEAKRRLVERAPGDLGAGVGRILDATAENPPAIPVAGGPVIPAAVPG